MIDLTGKSVFVKTQGEYLSVIKMAKLQGFTWAREDHLNPRDYVFILWNWSMESPKLYECPGGSDGDYLHHRYRADVH